MVYTFGKNDAWFQRALKANCECYAVRFFFYVDEYSVKLPTLHLFQDTFFSQLTMLICIN